MAWDRLAPSKNILRSNLSQFVFRCVQCCVCLLFIYGWMNMMNICGIIHNRATKVMIQHGSYDGLYREPACMRSPVNFPLCKSRHSTSKVHVIWYILLKMMQVTFRANVRALRNVNVLSINNKQKLWENKRKHVPRHMYNHRLSTCYVQSIHTTQRRGKEQRRKRDGGIFRTFESYSFSFRSWVRHKEFKVVHNLYCI